MKRVDFDPNGAPGSTGPGGRNIQNRGVCKFVRISWDEALDIVTAEMQRMRDTYGPTAILYQNDQHGENKTVHGPHGCGRKLLRPVRRLHPPGAQRRQLGRLVLGRQARVGLRVHRPADAAEEPALRHLQERGASAVLGLRPGDDHLGLGRPARAAASATGGPNSASSRSTWPRTCNYGNAVHADKWIPVLPNTDAALYLAIAHRWFEKGTYDKEYLETHAYGVDKFEDYVMGREDGVRQDAGMGGSDHAASRPAPSRPWPTSGRPSAPLSSSPTAARASAAPTPPSRPGCRCSAWPCRAWASRAATRPR